MDSSNNKSHSSRHTVSYCPQGACPDHESNVELDTLKIDASRPLLPGCKDLVKLHRYGNLFNMVHEYMKNSKKKIRPLHSRGVIKWSCGRYFCVPNGVAMKRSISGHEKVSTRRDDVLAEESTFGNGSVVASSYLQGSRASVLMFELSAALLWYKSLPAAIVDVVSKAMLEAHAKSPPYSVNLPPPSHPTIKLDPHPEINTPDNCITYKKIESGPVVGNIYSKHPDIMKQIKHEGLTGCVQYDGLFMHQNVACELLFTEQSSPAYHILNRREKNDIANVFIPMILNEKDPVKRSEHKSLTLSMLNGRKELSEQEKRSLPHHVVQLCKFWRAIHVNDPEFKEKVWRRAGQINLLFTQFLRDHGCKVHADTQDGVWIDRRIVQNVLEQFYVQNNLQFVKYREKGVVKKAA